MNIPNTITVIRMLLVPLLVYLLLHGAFGAAMWVFLAAGVSDALDGFIARRFGRFTRLGAVLDPLADKLLVVSSVLVLARLGSLPWWLALTIVARDLLIVGGAVAYCLRAGRLEMEPSVPGKMNTLVLVSLIYLVLGQEAGLVRVSGWLPVLFVLAFLTTVISGGHYVVVWGKKAHALKGGR